MSTVSAITRRQLDRLREREGSRLHCYGPNENAAAAASAAAVVFGLARAFYIN